MWLSKPISAHAEQEPNVEDEPHLTSRFDDDTLATMVQLYDVAKPYADRLGIDPYLAIGGPAGSWTEFAGPPDTVALTKVIRQMQQAGASADDIRQMLAENRRRATGSRTMPR
jgi:predicted metal-dependent phosphotriesterase family hydrolase